MDGFFKNRARSDGYSALCRTCHANRVGSGPNSHRSLRDRVFAKLGARCRACGYDVDERALAIDHVHGGGRDHRRNLVSSTIFMKAVLEDESGSFQVLCCNCNMIKAHENGERLRASKYHPIESPDPSMLVDLRRVSGKKRPGVGLKAWETRKKEPESVAKSNAAIAASRTGTKIFRRPDGSRIWIKPPPFEETS
jgi:hypothetical protein